MEYLLFEKSAVERILSISRLRSTEFLLGKTFIDILSGIDTRSMFTDIDGVFFYRNSHGCFFVGNDVCTTFILIDIEKSQLFDNFASEESMIIIHKLFRFAIRYWNSQSFTAAEKIITDTNKAVIFPFQFNTGSKFRIVLEREPDLERMQERGLHRLLLVYKCGFDGSSNYGEVAIKQNLREATEEYLKKRHEIREYFNILSTSRNGSQEFYQRPLEIIDAKGIPKEDCIYLPYSKWAEILTSSQREFIFNTDKTKPFRIQGPAGTGKTVSLILKSIFLLSNSKKGNQKCRIVFFTHSKATQLAVKNLFDIMSAGEFSDTETKDQSIEIISLHEFCIRTLSLRISENEVIDRDALESKNYQYMTIIDAFKNVYDRAFKSYFPILSPGFRSYISQNKNAESVCLLLQHEFSVQIKGKAMGDLENYLKLDNLINGLPLLNECDKRYIYDIFTEYQRSIESQHVYDTDDIVITAIGEFDNPIWRRRRKTEGYDYIFIDETHLFNINELLLLHFLSKSTDEIPISFTVDISQAIGDQGFSKENYEERYYLSGQAMKSDFDIVFRCSEPITNLAMSIMASGTHMFNNFLNPYSNTTSAVTKQGEVFNEIPRYRMYISDFEMIQGVTKTIESTCSALQCPRSEIAVIVFSDLLLDKVSEELKKNEISYVRVDSRGDLISKNSAAESNSIILTSPEFVGGLEFYAAILVGVDSGRVPPSNIDDISKVYLRYTAYNKLYLSVTRAKYRVTILGSLDYTISECLGYAIKQETVNQENV